jgi:hypothetical protein
MDALPGIICAELPLYCIAAGWVLAAVEDLLHVYSK